MTRVVLIADLHFGREDPGVVQPLLDAIDSAAADIIVIAGDFVQRARTSHFRIAADFMRNLNAPVFAVPGNHDIPLYNLPVRWTRPLAGYRKWISRDPEPEWSDDEVALIGIDTTNRWSHQSGQIGPGRIRSVCKAISHANGRLPVIVAHHPFHQSPDVAKKLMQSAPDALGNWADCGPHMILSGHVHSFFVEPFVTRKTDNMTLQIHCGTSVSTRRRQGAPNDFAIIDIAGGRVGIDRMAYADGKGFTCASQHGYLWGVEGWKRQP